MSSLQTAVINGLLAENVGKNDLVRSADSRAREADQRTADAEHRARMNEGAAKHVEVLRDKIAKLQQEVREAAIVNSRLINDKAAVESAYKDLLSRPMKDIAALNGDFKKTYELQQQMLAEWIMGQKAYKETAMQLGMSMDMTPEQVQKMAAPNYTAVLENRTQHGNDANSNPLLAEQASAILAIRKKNGKA